MSKSEIVNRLRHSFEFGVLDTLGKRRVVLNNIISMIEENSDKIVDACKKDLGRAKLETLVAEICLVKKEASETLASMENWLQDEYVPRSFVSMLDTPYIQRQPLGVVYILSAWNYPISLVLHPLIGAIAAGNTVLIKPSEYAPASAELLSEIIPMYISKDVCGLVCGGKEISESLLNENRFDHIFYTGGTVGARAIYQAAAKHLTPVTLELGGQCAAYVHDDAYLQMAAHRILFSKFYNAGQVCVATNHVLCPTELVDQLCTALVETIEEFYGEDPHKSPDFGRIVNDRHFERITNLLVSTKGQIIAGGQSISDERYIAPTIVRDVPKDDSLMSDELFGPILPIVSVNSPSEAVSLINQLGKPLAIYIFTNDKSVFDQFKYGTSSGAINQNDTFGHFCVSELPFGGVGGSGMGNYHGKFSIETFSHKRAVLIKSTKEYLNKKIMYPPYSANKESWVSWVLSPGKKYGCTIL